MVDAPPVGRIRRLLTNPYALFLILAGLGALVAILIGLFVEPRWTGICDSVRHVTRCRDITAGSAIAGSFVVFGLVVMILGPIVAAFWGLRGGWDFEGSRVEPRRVNLTILAGILYVAAGFIIRIVVI